MIQEIIVLMDPFRDCRIKFTRHAQQRSNERSITSDDVKRILRKGTPERLDDEKYRITYGTLTVIGKLFKCNLIVITTYSD